MDIATLKDRLRRIAVSNIFVYRIARWAIGVIPAMLPHEQSFHGLALFGGGDAIFLDIGANDGISAKSYRHLVPDRPIVSIEANPQHRPTLEQLQAKIEDFSFHILGAGSSESQLTLYTPIYKGVPLTNYASVDPDLVRANLAYHMGIRDIDSRVTFAKNEVQVLPLDDLNLDPAVIKIDVEGFEHEVLKGLERTLDRAKPVIMVEYNEQNFSSVRDPLVDLGYGCYEFFPGKGNFKPWRDSEPALNMFFLSEDHLASLRTDSA